MARGQHDMETMLNARPVHMLDGMRHNWTMRTEQSGMMENTARIDVLVVSDGWPHVTLECTAGIKPDGVAKRFDNNSSRWRCVLGALPSTTKLHHRMARTAASRNESQEWFRTV